MATICTYDKVTTGPLVGTLPNGDRAGTEGIKKPKWARGRRSPLARFEFAKPTVAQLFVRFVCAFSFFLLVSMKQANNKKRARPTSPITGVDGSDRAREEEELPAAEDVERPARVEEGSVLQVVRFLSLNRFEF